MKSITTENYKTGKALAKNLRLVIAHARHKSLQLNCALKVEHKQKINSHYRSPTNIPTKNTI